MNKHTRVLHLLCVWCSFHTSSLDYILYKYIECIECRAYVVVSNSIHFKFWLCYYSMLFNIFCYSFSDIYIYFFIYIYIYTPHSASCNACPYVFVRTLELVSGQVGMRKHHQSCTRAETLIRTCPCATCIWCCILLLLVPKMVLTLCNLHSFVFF